MKYLKLNIQRFAEDGSVTIAVKADTKQFDKDMVSLQKRLHELSKKAQAPIEIDGAKVTGGWNLSEEEQREYDEISSQLNEINQKEQERIQTEKQVTQELQNQKEAKAENNVLSNEENVRVGELRAKLSELVGVYNDIQKQDVIDTKDLEYAEKLKQDIIETRNELEKISGTRVSIKGIDGIENNINNIGNSMEKVTKKVAKWGLAIFGIRSMYMGIRQVVGQLLQTDEGLKNQIDYMKWSIGQAIKPIVEWLIEAVHQLLVWIGAILKLLFGWNIFSNATADNFKKANGQAKKMQKTLAGFDEMNILNEDGSTGIANSIGNALKGWDLAKEVDELTEKLRPFEDLIKGIAIVAGSIFGAKMIGNMVSGIGTLIGSKGLGKLGSKLSSLALVAGSIVITGIIAKNVWEETEQLKKDIKSIRDNGGKAQEKWIENEEDINKLIKTGNVNRQAGINLLKQSEGYIERQLDLDKEMVETAKQTAINISKQINKEIELYNAGKLNNEEKEKLKQNIKEQISYNEMVIEKLRLQGKDTKEIEDINKRLNTQLYAVGNQIQWNKDMVNQWAIENDKIKVGFDGTVTILEGANKQTETFNSFLKKAGDKIREVNRTKIDNKSATVTMKMEMDTSSAERSTNTFLNKWGTKIKQAFSGSSSNIFGAKGMLYTPPKLAVGGIINQPGRGVPIGTALGGERGMEGVIPLTDSQQMELLGEAIGRYISVNLTNITELDGRQIARKVEQINQNDRFVLNR